MATHNLEADILESHVYKYTNKKISVSICTDNLDELTRVLVGNRKNGKLSGAGDSLVVENDEERLV